MIIVKHKAESETLRERERETGGLAAKKMKPTSVGLFFKHKDTNSLRGREKCSSSCRITENALVATFWRTKVYHEIRALINQKWINKNKNLKHRTGKSITWGGFSRGMIKSTLMGCRSASGGSPLAISIAVIPSDQISACTEEKHLRCLTQTLSKGIQRRTDIGVSGIISISNRKD